MINAVITGAEAIICNHFQSSVGEKKKNGIGRMANIVVSKSQRQIIDQRCGTLIVAILIHIPAKIAAKYVATVGPSKDRTGSEFMANPLRKYGNISLQNWTQKKI
jgi:hypothetical protein